MSVTATILAVLSSSLLSAALTGFFALQGKRRDYVDAYFRQVLDKRLAAYALIEAMIANFKTTTPHPSGSGVHIVFHTDAVELLDFSTLLFRISSESFWLSDEMFATSRKIGILLTQKEEGISWIKFGAARYYEFASIRVDLEKLYSRDMAVLHLIPKFLKSKRHIDAPERLDFPRSSFTREG